MGRSFALHGFSGNIGFALAPPTIAALLSVMDWRDVLLVVVAAVIAQSHILRDQVRKDTPERGMSMRALHSTAPWACSSCSISSAPWRAAA